MRTVVRTWLLIALAILATFDTGHADSLEEHEALATLDLTGWDANSVISIAGPWDFYWNKRLEFGIKWPEADLRMERIGQWTGKQTRHGEILSHKGFGTYAIRLVGLKSRPDGYLLSLTSIDSAARVLVFDATHSKLLADVQVGDPGETFRPSRHPLLVHFNPYDSDDVRVIIQAANQVLAHAGIWQMPDLGPPKLVQKSMLIDGFANAVSMGVALAVAFYSVLIFLRRRQEKASLALACFSFAIFVRSFATTPFVAAVLPESVFIPLRRAEYTAIPFMIIACYYFLQAAFFPKSYKVLSYIVTAPALALGALSLFAPPFYFTSSLGLFQFHFVLTCGTVLWILGHALYAQREDSWLVLIGIGIGIIASIYDLVFVAILQSSNFFIGPIGIAIFLLIQSQLVAKRAANAYQRSEQLADSLKDLSANLQREVESQTEKLKLQRDKLIEQKQEIAEAHEKLQVVDQKKTRFFQNISHELRTPLTLILASQKSLLERFPQEEDLSIAERNSRRLLRLVNQLLDFQKLTQTDQQLSLRPIKLVSFLNNCTEYIRKACDSKQIRLITAGLSDDDVTISGQTDALEKVVFNYLSNALKYTPKGGQISIGIERHDLHVRFYVQDTGPGIAAKDQDRLFQLFSQVDDSDKRAYEGTGLGLALVKELITKMDGQVGVESELGQGTRFWADFPVMDDQKILQLILIDDDESVREDFAQRISELTTIKRYKIFENAEQAIPYLSTHRLQVVLSDAVLPGMDGPGFLNEVAKRQPKAHRILITGKTENHQIVQKAINVAKVEKVFYKPIGNEIFSILETLAQDSQNKTNKKVHDLLLVDDDRRILTVMVKRIRSSNLVDNVMVASSLMEAKRVLQENRFKVVISDADLGNGESGVTLLELLLQSEPDTRRILLTAERASAVLAEAINRGKIHHIHYKPIDFDSLLSMLKDAIASSNVKAIIPMAEDEPGVAIKDWHLADIEVQNTTSEVSEDVPDSKDSQKGTVLICDDVPDMRQLMGRCLRNVGYKVFTASDGQEGLKKVRELKPDLVVTDWMMPKMTGPELIQELHGDELLSSIPTILLTAKSDDESRMMGTQVGATAYLAKPFDEIELQTMVRNLIDLKKGEKKIAELNRYLTEKVLCRFLPPKLVEQIVRGETVIDQKATMMPVTILFADICDFTRISEDLGPQKVSTVLNQFLEKMVATIFNHGGTIDKFMGDAVMAIFGAPEPISTQEQVRQACRCAAMMQTALQQLNSDWLREGLPEFQMRIGLHQGPAVVGQFGSELRSEYTAIGPTVNYAARVQAHAEPGSIYLSMAVRDHVIDGWQPAGTFDLKGIGEVQLFRLRSDWVDREIEAA